MCSNDELNAKVGLCAMQTCTVAELLSKKKTAALLQSVY